MPIYADRDPKGKLTGRWRAQVRKDGKTIKSSRFETYQEAVNWERNARTDVVTTFIAEKKTMKPKDPVVTLGELYLKGSGVIWRGKASENTSEVRFRSLVRMIGPDTPLTKITTVLIDDLIKDLIKTRKGSTVNRFLSILHRALDWAVECEFLGSLPVFHWQEEEDGRIRWITSEEETRLYELLPEKYARLVRVAIKTGMRRGELLSLKYDQAQPKKVHLWNTKNKLARTVPIDLVTHDNLMWLLDHGMPSEPELRWAWDKARETMGLTNDPYFVFHVCRHTCCTRLVEANVNLRVIQAWMGHKRIETTIRYAQIKNSMLEDALTKLNDLEDTHVDYIHLRSHPVTKEALLNACLVEETVVTHCGRGGTGRRAGFRSSDDDEENQ